MRPNSLTAGLAVLAVLAPLPGLSYAQTYAPAPAASGGNPLSSIFGCDTAGGKQAGGAVVGGLVGGLLGNSLSGRNRTLGTVLGAAGGAALGSYVGCRMQHSDAVKAEAAARQALESNGAQSWTNAETGASGSVKATPLYGGPAPSLAGLRLAPGVELASSYEGAPPRYQARSTVNLRGGPSLSAPVVGKLQAGETIDVVGRVGGAAWLLASRGGVGIGYVSESAVQPLGAPSTGASASPCKSVEQTIRTGDGKAEVQRYTACRNAGGDWVIQA